MIERGGGGGGRLKMSIMRKRKEGDEVKMNTETADIEGDKRESNNESNNWKKRGNKEGTRLVQQ